MNLGFYEHLECKCTVIVVLVFILFIFFDFILILAHPYSIAFKNG